MVFRFSCPHTSPQNGKAERKIKTINNIVRTLLASVPHSFWHHALAMATYLHNILPTKILGYKTPTHILYQKNPSYEHLRVFGCLCFPLFPSTQIHKLQARSTPCIFLGFPSNHRGYICYDPSSRKMIIARHVVFDECEFPFSKLHKPSSSHYDFLEEDNNPLRIHLLHQSHSGPPEQVDLSQLQEDGPTPSEPNSPLANQYPRATPLSSPYQQSPNISAQSISPSLGPINPPPSSPTSPVHHTASPLYQPPHLRLGLTQPSPVTPKPPTMPRMTTRSQHGIHKPNLKYALNAITPTISPIPRNPIGAINDPN